MEDPIKSADFSSNAGPRKCFNSVMTGQANWVAPPHQPELGSDDVQIWSACLDVPADTHRLLRALLNPEERARADRFLQPVHRIHNAAGRGWLRSLLARYLEAAPQSIEFRFNEHGKPSLAGIHESSRLRFNISHSHGFALFAFARDRELGVDLEKIRLDRSFQRIAERFFAPGETARLRSIPAAQQAQAFFECWTRKEAYIKARGKGLSLPLDSFQVEFGPGAAPALLQARGEPDAPARWALFDLEPFPEFAGAIAVERPLRKLYCWRVES